MTIWKSLGERFPDYEANDKGEIRCIVPRRNWPANRLVSPHPDSDGYQAIHLRDHNGVIRHVHVSPLICAAYHGEKPTQAHEVSHNNNIRNDNRPDNLRWDTHPGNCADKWHHGTHQHGEIHPEAKLTNEDVWAIDQMRAKGAKLRTIAEIFGINKGHVGRILKRESWKNLPKAGISPMR